MTRGSIILTHDLYSWCGFSWPNAQAEPHPSHLTCQPAPSSVLIVRCNTPTVRVDLPFTPPAYSLVAYHHPAAAIAKPDTKLTAELERTSRPIPMRLTPGSERDCRVDRSVRILPSLVE